MSNFMTLTLAELVLDTTAEEILKFGLICDTECLSSFLSIMIFGSISLCHSYVASRWGREGWWSGLGRGIACLGSIKEEGR